jgi:hypothetical protein
MLAMFWTRESFCQHVCCLLWIPTGFDINQFLFDKVSNPMPSDCNMFAPIMELLVLGHCD